MSKIQMRFIRLAFFSDTHTIRAMMVIAESIWAFSLFHPAQTFLRPTYAGMAHVASENVWGSIFAFSALVQLWILTTGRYHDAGSVIFSAFNMVLWWFVVLSMWFSVTVPAGISGEIAMCCSASYLFIRSGWIPHGSRRCHADA